MKDTIPGIPRLPHVFIFVCGATAATIILLAFAVPGAGASGPALVRIDLWPGDDPAALPPLVTTAYEHVTAAGGDFVLAGASPAQQAALREAGFSVTLLAPEADRPYYWAYPAPGAELDPALARQALASDGEGVLVPLSAEDAGRYADRGVSLRLLLPSPMLPAAPGGEIAARGYDYQPLPGPSTTVQQIIAQVDQADVYDYTGGLSGEWAVSIGGSPYTILSRNSYSGTPINRAGQYLYEFYDGLGLDVSYHNFYMDGIQLRNVVAEKRGSVSPERVFMLTAHYDSQPPGAYAPGADDNASGVVGTMMAAEILGGYEFGCTLRFVDFSAEEQGLVGSYYYAQETYCGGEQVEGVLNLDMLAWNTQGSSTYMDLHARSSVPGSMDIAYLFGDVVSTYGLNLNPVIESNGTNRSDHARFWAYNVPSILAIEAFGDFNPYYHTTNDRLDRLKDMPYYTAMVKASIATFAHMGCLLEDGTGTVTGAITDDTTGQPVPYALVAFASPDWPYSVTARADANGIYTQEVAPGTHDLMILAPGYDAVEIAGVTATGGGTTVQDAAMSPGGGGFHYMPLIRRGQLSGCP